MPSPQHMSEALTLARRGLGCVEPNPMVGAVIVRGDRVIGRGWHRRFGGPHAEIEALRDAADRGEDVRGATIYVTLEPCCHVGKTGPCTEAILAAGLGGVVAAVEDPNPAVAGKGLTRLREAGLAVEVGLLADEARELLAEYLKLRRTGRPWVICKWAQTLDGRIATRAGHSQWISSEASRQRVHQLRAVCDGILIGIGTARHDDPRLTNRTGQGRQPTRVVLDEDLDLSAESQLARTTGEAPLLVATTQDGLDARPAHADALRAAGAELLALPRTAHGVDLPALLDELGRRQWTRLLVEGGSGVLGAFLGGHLADELRVFLAPRILGGREGLPCVSWEELDTMDQALPLPAPTVEPIGIDLLLTYRLG